MKIKHVLIVIVLLLITSNPKILAQGNVAINTTGSGPDNSAMLDITSTSKGMLIPRMSTSQRTGIASPARGLMVYDNDLDEFWYYDGAAWVSLSASPADNLGNHTATTNIRLNGNWLSNDGSNTGIQVTNSGNVGIGTSIPAAPLDVTGTSSVKIPVGNSSQRPASPAKGMMRYNTTYDRIEYYNGTDWRLLGYRAYAFGTGGTVTEVGGYRIHTFTGSGTFTVDYPGLVEVLVIGGGGGGGLIGGGGAGGVLYDPSFAVTVQAYTVTVGAGGAGGANGSSSVFSTITAAGGGFGGGETSAASAGGSGGGGPGNGAGGAASPAGQGNAGGSGSNNGAGTSFSGGGGGGSGSAGTNASGPGVAGSGGSGSISSISGTAVTRGGGGGGGAYILGSTGSAGSGGSGGGGTGGRNGLNATSGTANTGGGGGGRGLTAAGSGQGAAAGSGGSGIVIIRYPIYD